jgi:hypothetical protein
MTREQERQILRQNMNHYLWHKPRAQWTEQDLINLLGKSISGREIQPPELKKRPHKQPVIVKTPEGEKEYESVVLCAAELEIEPLYIYQRINGHLKNEGEYQFFKSKMNQ